VTPAAIVPRPLVLKLGGELLEDRAHLATVVQAVRTIAVRNLPVQPVPLVIVHGGGKEIDARLKAAGIEKRQVDGLRVTDEATLDVVVAVLAGAINTRFVAALNAAGVDAVGLTGVDAHVGLAAEAPLHVAVDGRIVNLGYVGVPVAESPTRRSSATVSSRSWRASAPAPTASCSTSTPTRWPGTSPPASTLAAS
jgi:acetylglutamate kinase